jgi:hypothetical protein
VRDVPLQQQIIDECHDALYAGHFGSAKTLARIQRQFHWQNIHDDVATYYNTCVSCRRFKPSNRKPAGLLNPFPTPLIPWFVISLDFITHMPKTDDDYDCIMVVIDKFSKRAHFIPTTSETTAHVWHGTIILRHSLESSWITINNNL